ncbi:MAG: TfoX/Sxy family protein [Saprospiraceae bacterium]|nr:TfoX/Sxy family protein [Saprospiraceae bacterium]
MAYDELLADRIRHILKSRHVVFTEKKMMGGIGFMVDDKLCIGIFRNELMCRVHPEKMPDYLERTGARQMMHGKRQMKGYLNIADEGFDMDSDLEFWVQACLLFNPLAKSSKKKK